MRDSDTGSYVCTVSSGSLSVMSNAATLTVYGMFVYVVIVCNMPLFFCIRRSSSDHRSSFKY